MSDRDHGDVPVDGTEREGASEGEERFLVKSRRETSQFGC